MANYSFEKGKYGSTTGTILPFPRRLDGKFGTDWKLYVPAGFLRCDGSVLNAVDYPALAEILGTGEECIYKKDNVELTNDKFQLPDLGSKYIKASPSSGGYDEYYARNPSGNVESKVGIDVVLESNEGSSGRITIPVQYTGSFSIPSRSVNFSGNFAISISSVTSESTVGSDEMLGHGHWGNIVYRRPDEKVDTGVDIDTDQTYGGECKIEAENTESFVGSDGLTEGATSHSHTVKYGTPPTKSVSGNISAFTASAADAIFTDVQINIGDTYAINDVQIPFILVEYLIKY